MQFNRETFFAAYRKAFGSLKQNQVRAIESLLAAIENDNAIDDLRHIAYILATIKHETAHTFEPIEEYGKGKGHTYGKKDAVTGEAYYGRGFVQLTWKRNYQIFSNLLGVDLVNEPELALDPEIAWQITSIGMREGLFTRKKLSDYINDDKVDYANARRIINGMDKAMALAGYAKKFQAMLEDALTEPQAVSATNNIRNAVADITPSSEPAVQPEQPAQAKVEIKDGNILASTSEGKPPEPETVVIEKPEPKSFAAEIKKDLGWVTGGEVGLQGIRDTAEKWNVFGLSARFWLWISIIALVVGAVYIGTKMYKHWMDSRRDMQITQSLIEGNTTPTNKVILASKEELEKFKDEKGFKVVTR